MTHPLWPAFWQKREMLLTGKLRSKWKEKEWDGRLETWKCRKRGSELKDSVFLYGLTSASLVEQSILGFPSYQVSTSWFSVRIGSLHFCMMKIYLASHETPIEMWKMKSILLSDLRNIFPSLSCYGEMQMNSLTPKNRGKKCVAGHQTCSHITSLDFSEQGVFLRCKLADWEKGKKVPATFLLSQFCFSTTICSSVLFDNVYCKSKAKRDLRKHLFLISQALLTPNF